ncbi:hypothetical protein ACFFK0_19075 [Paenibacillus chartarius]|uniref:Integral membrane protein n=1 Tax=Paenibacillus chartarius TaxID=747481 RepID=A0ABV6DPG4_9BACL
MNRINPRWAGNILLVTFVVLVIFHILVIAQVVPAGMVWGGQFQGSTGSLLMVEIFALLLTVVFALFVALKLRYVYIPISGKIAQTGVWVLFAYFVLNTLGNLAAVTWTEKLVFTPITIVLAILTYRVARMK